MDSLPFAHEMSYWKSSQSGVESWLDKTERLIESVGGAVHTRITGKSDGREAILLTFVIEGDWFKIMWPSLPVKNEKDKAAAMRQAATMVYHDTKSRVNRIKIFSARVVFSDWFLLTDGSTIAESGTIDFPSVIKQIAQ